MNQDALGEEVLLLLHGQVVHGGVSRCLGRADEIEVFGVGVGKPARHAAFSRSPAGRQVSLRASQIGCSGVTRSRSSPNRMSRRVSAVAARVQNPALDGSSPIEAPSKDHVSRTEIFDGDESARRCDSRSGDKTGVRSTTGCHSPTQGQGDRPPKPQMRLHCASLPERRFVCRQSRRGPLVWKRAALRTGPGSRF